MKDYIFIYCEDFNTKLKTSKFHYIKYLLDNNSRVIYVETPLSILSLIFNFGSFVKNFKKIFGYDKKDQLILTGNINFFPFHRFCRFDLFNKINQIHNIMKINKIINKYNFKNINLIIYSPLLNEQIFKLKNIKNKIFIINDDYSAFDEKFSSILIKNYSNYIFKNSDYVFYNSAYCLKNLIFEKNLISKRNLFKIAHGVTQKLNMIVPEQKKVKNIFYYGQINKVNIDLIIDLAKNFNNYFFHIIGNLNNFSFMKFSYINNLKFYPAMERENLMELISNYDLALFPFRSNKLTNSMLPIKIFEMINLNKPVITTNLPAIREVFGDHIHYISDENSINEFKEILQNIKKKYNYRFNNSFIKEWNEIFYFIDKKING